MFWRGNTPNVIPCSGIKNVNHISCSGVTESFFEANHVSIISYHIVLYCIILYSFVSHPRDGIISYCVVLYGIDSKEDISASLILSNDSTILF